MLLTRKHCRQEGTGQQGQCRQTAQAQEEPLARLVLWFHHIKDITKRKNIVSWAAELDVRGFSKPGFPGVLICEGRLDDVQVNLLDFLGQGQQHFIVLVIMWRKDSFFSAARSNATLLLSQ